MLKLWKRLALAGALASACAAAPAQAQPAQLLPGPTPQKVHDQTGRLVGTLFPADSPAGRTKVLVPLPNGEALLNIGPDRLSFFGTGRRPAKEHLDPNLYYASSDCSGPAYIMVRHFLNYAQSATRPASWADGVSPPTTIRYAARPFMRVDLVSQKDLPTEREKLPPANEFLACKPLPQPLFEQLVGVARTFTLPSYKLPFVVK